MLIWIAILLGLIQGFTEFLPISSSGHLVIFESLFKVSFDYNLLNVLLHFSTLIAVIYYYRKQIWYQITHPFCKLNQYLLLATIPAVIFVLLFHNFLDNNMSKSIFLGIGFIISAILLIIAQVCISKMKNNENLNYYNTLLMGLAQAFAIFPGLSRSGTTLSFGLLSGIEKNKALDFSFLMSIPIIIASIIYELIFQNPLQNINQSDIIPIIISCIFAFVSAFLGLILMKKIIKKIKLWYFAPYLILIGILVIIFL